jgi:hypothetical protein
MTQILFEVGIIFNDDEPVDQQLDPEWIEDEDDEQFFSETKGKMFGELTIEQIRKAADWKFKDDVVQGLAGDTYAYELLGIALQ